MLRPFDENYIADPHPTFKKIRESTPVYFDEAVGCWVVSKYQDVQTVLRDPTAFANYLTPVPLFPLCPHAESAFMAIDVAPVTVGADAPIHPRTRKAIVSCFPTNPRGAAIYEEQVRKRVSQLIDEMIARGRADMMREFAGILPIYVIMDLLGVDDTEFRRIKGWSDGQVALMAGRPDEAEQVRLVTGMREFFAFCRELVAERERAPANDFPSALLRYRGGDDEVLTKQEIASILWNFLIAGHETTTNLLGNGLYNLLRTPGVWQRLVDDRSLISGAVEEMLRFGPPIITWVRVATRDVELGGQTIPSGQRLLLLLASANRDADQFSGDPEAFLIDRPGASKHLSFGMGSHFCVGNALARLEVKIALELLTEKLPRLRLEDGFGSPDWIQNVEFRGMKSLPLRWD
ncbi:MAG TPA: cytochrome P450 [Sphingobium sp.]|nr:cytochrome P450 [Sphingobium sp.]